VKTIKDLIWLSFILLVANIISHHLNSLNLFAWSIFGINFFASLALWSFLILKARNIGHELQSLFINGLLDLATMKRSEFGLLVFTSFVLFGYFINLLTNTNYLTLFSCIFLLFFVVGIVAFADLQIPTPTLSSELVQTPGLILFASRFREDLFNQFSNCIEKSPNDLNVWRKIIKEIGNFYTEVAQSLKTPVVLEKVAQEVSKKVNDKLKTAPDDEKRIWECVSLIIQTPLIVALRAIEFHLDVLEHIWVVVTQEGQYYYDALNIIIKKVFNNLKIYKKQLNEPYDINAIQSIVNTIYAEANSKGLTEDKVTVDITGGTALMSVGGVLACVRSRRRVEYLRQDNFKFASIPVTILNVKDALTEFFDQVILIIQENKQKGG
jgi:hypothetical protein